MWKPREVVPEHRRRAWVVWACLLLAITAYAIWEIFAIKDKYKNPSTSTTVTNEYFRFPYVTVCLDVGTGCSTWSNCATSTTARFSRVYINGQQPSYYSSGDDHTALLVESKHPGCLGFDLSQHNVNGFETAVIDMVWEVAGGSASSDARSDDASSNSTWNFSWSHFEHVYVFLDAKEPDELDDTTYLTMPYQPITASTVETADSYLTIGKTVKTALNGDVQISFPALTLSQSKYKMDSFYLSLDDGVEYGQMYLSLRQGPFSSTTITELNPLEIGTYLGNIGGFWELLIVVWGICFVMKRQERGPALKSRTFKIPLKMMRKGKVRTRAMVSPEEGEERPHWEVDVEPGESRHESATTTALPVGASGHAANHSSRGSLLGDASSPGGPKKGQPRCEVATGTGTGGSRRQSAGAPKTAFGRGFFRSAFSQHRKKKRSGSLDNTAEHVATKRDSFRRAVELGNRSRTESESGPSRGQL